MEVEFYSDIGSRWLALIYICASGTLTKNTKKIRMKEIHYAMTNGGSYGQREG